MSSGEEGLDEDDFGFRGRAETPDDSVEGDGAKKKRKDKKRRKRTPAEKEARRLRKEAEAAARNPGGASPSGSVPSDDSAMSGGLFGSRMQTVLCVVLFFECTRRADERIWNPMGVPPHNRSSE